MEAHVLEEVVELSECAQKKKALDESNCTQLSLIYIAHAKGQLFVGWGGWRDGGGGVISLGVVAIATCNDGSTSTLSFSLSLPRSALGGMCACGVGERNCTLPQDMRGGQRCTSPASWGSGVTPEVWKAVCGCR